ncbi:CAP-associated domain-containing protein [Solibacillus sp. CAU 1738]|uniref:CAP domain-containing protein n=1 Tax=Solibacillus sp. CAU 1738 TaxID=3140363 RepID=UPI003261A1E6
MEALFRILIIVTFIAIVYYYAGPDATKHEPLEGPTIVQQPILKSDYSKVIEDVQMRPEEGLSTYIGEPSETLLVTYGLPIRIDKTPFQYDWWIYNGEQGFIMFGVSDDKIVQVYTNTNVYDVAPYEIGQSLDDIYRMTIIDSEVTVQLGDNIYLFSMNDADMSSRILVKFKDVYAQLYIDTVTKQLAGIRFLNGETLVEHKPYEMQFIGELIDSSTPSSFAQHEIHKASAAQLLDLTNVIRKKYGVPTLVNDAKLNELAMQSSENMFLKNMETQQSEDDVSLKDKLIEAEIEYKSVDQNIATAYYDAIEVMHGWLNSKEHRAMLLNDTYSHVGTGVFLNYYTQIFIETNINTSLAAQ